MTGSGTIAPSKEEDKDDDDEDDDNVNGPQKKEQDEGRDNDEDSNDDPSSQSEGDDDEDDDGDRYDSDDDSNNGLSDYEKLRLERIKRNEERLAKLGLHSKDGGGVLGKQVPQPPKRKRKSPKEQEPVERRERLSRSTKKDVNYAKDFEFKLSQLPNGGRFPHEKKERKNKKSNAPTKNDFQHRVPLFIYQEFQRMKARRKENLRHAKQASKQAQRELKHWKRQVEIVIKREKLKKDREKLRQEKKLQKKLNVSRLEKERQLLGGKTRREILNEVDQRNDELTQLVNSYDKDRNMIASFQSEKEKKIEFERKMKMVDSLDRFPKAVNEALTTLNALLLGRSPKDPTPSRRSKRSSEEVAPPARSSSSSNKRIKISLKKGKFKAKKVTSSSSPNGGEVDDDGGSSAWTNFASTLAANNKADITKKKPSSTKTLAVTDNSKKEKTKKIKDPRNVGGWISPQFAKHLDRSWLEREKPTRSIPPPPAVPKGSNNKVFDLKSYVPQVGDVVLYYPSAHRDFLNMHPDFLNQKQLKNNLRYPLWIRGKREMNRLSSGNLTLNDLPNLWWTDDWVNDLNDNQGKKKKGPSISDYPIVCRVERVHNEFPHDPYAGQKKVTKTNDGTVINYTGPARVHPTTSRSKKKLAKSAHAHLCALLKPLTPILPPGVVPTDPYVQEEKADGAGDDDVDGRASRSNKTSVTSKFSSSTSGLSIPPSLTAVVFPSSTASAPFIVPFCWGYAMHNSLTVDEPIWTPGGNTFSAGKGTITEIKSSAFKIKVDETDDGDKEVSGGVDSSDNSTGFSIDDKLDEVEALLTRLQSRGPLAKSVEDELASNGIPIEIPVREVCAILDFLSKLAAERRATSKPLAAPKDKTSLSSSNEKGRQALLSIADLILWTLPSRNSISISLESNHRLTRRTSCWKLYTLQPTDLSRSFQNGLLGTLDSVIREKAEMCIDEFLKDNENAYIFVPPITEEAAPSYYLAVPVGMHFGRIMARLKANSHGQCYYRSIEAVQFDLQAITDNCCLYNAPDSEIALLSADYVQECKRMMSDIVNQHERANNQNEMTSVLSSTPKTITNGKRPRFPYNLNTPFSAAIDKEWLGRIAPDGTADPASKNIKINLIKNEINISDHLQSWVPQCGDTVLYSRSRHLTFVTTNADSLSPPQQTVQKIGVNSDEDDNQATERECDDGDDDASNEERNSALASNQVDGEPKDPSDAPTQEEIESSWLEAMVVAVRPTFPKKTDKPTSFVTTKPILVIELNLRYSWSKQDTILVSWRPSEESFILPTWLAGNTEPRIPADTPLSGVESNLPSSSLELMGQCFNFLKSRVMEGIAPELINPDEVLSNAVRGIVSGPPSNKLPSFEDILVCKSVDSKKATTGLSKKLHVGGLAKERLASLNYLPLWMKPEKKLAGKKPAEKKSGGTKPGKATNAKQKQVNRPLTSKNGKSTKVKQKPANATPDAKTGKATKGKQKQVNRRPYYEMMLPVHTLSLELIRLRIINGYYRHALAVVSDISESYVSSVLFLLHKHAKRTKDALSIRTIAKYLKSPQGNGLLPKFSRKRKEFGKASTSSLDAKSEGPPDDFTSEEKKVVVQIHSIRMLHAVAMACVTDTAKVQRLFFLLPKDVDKPPEEEQPIVVPTTTNRTAEEIKAIQTIRNLLLAVQRDRADNKTKFAKTGIFKLRIKCDRKVVTENGFVENLKDGRFMFEPSSTIARIESPEIKNVRVSIRVGDELICGARSANMTATKFILPKGVEGQSFIELDHDDFEENDDFTTAIFTKERRRSPCLRCQAKGNGLFHCRVMKGHSNIDFAFDDHFKGSGGLKKSLLLPWTKDSPQEENVNGSKNEDHDGQSDSDEEKDEDENNPDKENQTDESWEKRAEDARIQADKSRKAAELAGYLFSQAQLMADEEVKLSQEFIDDYFPKDEEGMYTYCSICGLSGDVICCETCPVVMHPKCIGFDEIPEDDWFCPRCVTDGKDDEKVPSQDPGKRPRRRTATDSKADYSDPKPDSNVLPDDGKEGKSDSSANDPADAPVGITQVIILTPASESTSTLKIKIIHPSSPSSSLKAAPKPELKTEEDIEQKQEELDNLLEELIGHREKLDGLDPKKKAREEGKSSGKKAEPVARKRGRPARDPSDNPIENLPLMGRRFCADIGVTSADDFLDTPSSELTQKFIEWREEVGERPLHGSGPSAYISMFKAQVRQEIEGNNTKRERSSQKVKASGRSGTNDSSTNTKPKQKRRRRSAGDDPWVAVAPDPRIKAALNKEPRPQDDESDVDEPPSGRRSMAGTTEERYLRAIQKGSDDPLENLPALGRKFLEWAGITDPEEFVSTKTTELADSFTKYRRIANMSVLNGSGAAAYCGAWKSQVRKQLALQEEFGISRETTTNDDGDADADDESDIGRINTTSRKRKHRASAVTDVEVSTPTKKMPRKGGNLSNSRTTKSTITNEDDDAGEIDDNEENVENHQTKNDTVVKETTSKGGRRRVTTDRFGYN
mmetsp:Transcript_36975/g.89753  ORF Transcript_36975/g.89753 Transcript_36975/m.89753 type:complete len:2489 (+) Transcript_36975:912-8378(+)